MGIYTESERQVEYDVLSVGEIVSLVYTKDRRFQILEKTPSSIRLRALDQQDSDFWEPTPNIIVDVDDGA